MQHPSPATDDILWRETVAQCISGAGIMDEEVETTLLKSFLALPRTLFVEGVSPEHALIDVDIPAGFDQWLTRPSLQVRMLALIQLKKRMRVMELGFGSGYLCAVMEHAGAHVFGVEQIGLLAQRTRKNLDALGHHGVVVRRGEGAKGWADSGPYDALVISYPVVNEAEIPFDQLRRGGTGVGVLVPEHTSNAAPAMGQLCLWTRGLGSVRRVTFEEATLR